jgi:hypothetical protein
LWGKVRKRGIYRRLIPSIFFVCLRLLKGIVNRERIAGVLNLMQIGEGFSRSLFKKLPGLFLVTTKTVRCSNKFLCFGH